MTKSSPGNKNEIGKININGILVTVYWREGHNAEASLSKDTEEETRIDIGFDTTYPDMLVSFLHETMELTMVALNKSYMIENNSMDMSGRLFLMQHSEFAECIDICGNALAQIYNDLIKCYYNYHKKI